ncbi:MAG: hypothetical protein PF630_06735 [Gammaproteobacteria bacterium]|jgi:hypothetical protein|nr:hypothetical protein [Gammaproteobacteria bacterium]
MLIAFNKPYGVLSQFSGEGCIQHHFDHAFDMAVGGYKPANIQPEPPGNG